ncbi:hypothetical protein KEJ19_07450 [Candidatus Bathyarchaeota archaeon]|nr:hypothetical protein [Candidatus Bathyarchaeota archaeon]
MSLVSPDELINEIRPWDESSWKKLIETYIVPLKALAGAVAKYFVGDASSDVSKALADRATYILEVAKKNHW